MIRKEKKSSDKKLIEGKFGIIASAPPPKPTQKLEPKTLKGKKK